MQMIQLLLSSGTVCFNFLNLVSNMLNTRRPDFSPDGSLLVTPTGIYRSQVPLGSERPMQSFCCHVFTRNQLALPTASLAGLEEPAIAVRFSPAVYKKINILQSAEGDNAIVCDSPLDKSNLRYPN